ncbi:MAG: acetyl-CoA C-acetyltransferase [bacterium]
MKDVVIVDYLRTAQSRSRPQDPARDWFHKIRADELLGQLLPELLKRTGVDKEEVDDFIVGSAMGVGEQWTWGGRTPLLLANLSERTGSKFVGQQCGSGMAAIQIGFMEIATGNADIVIAGGMEHLTRIPIGTTTANPKLSTEERYQHWNMATSVHMGLIAEAMLKRSGLARTDLDEWALRSHRLAAAAQQRGFFEQEILPVEAEQADGSKLLVKHDQAVRADTSLASLAALKPAYQEGGAITAGNASPLNAGATSMLLMARETAMRKGIKPMAAIKAIAFAGVPPDLMGTGPVPASKKVLKAAGLAVADIDCWEINEAFAIVTLHCMRALGIASDQVNVMGGGIALGHPLGASGIRLVGTLARILQETGGRYGLATACVGGGQGVATIIEREPR